MTLQIAGNIPGESYARVEIDGETITSVRNIGKEKANRNFICPGFVDLQLNGFSGVDFSSSTLTAEEVIAVLPSLWKTGTTTFCPTLITNSHERLRKNIQVLEQARQINSNVRASVPCYHLEGPYLSPNES